MKRQVLCERKAKKPDETFPPRLSSGKEGALYRSPTLVAEAAMKRVSRVIRTGKSSAGALLGITSQERCETQSTCLKPPMRRSNGEKARGESERHSDDSRRSKAGSEQLSADMAAWRLPQAERNFKPQVRLGAPFRLPFTTSVSCTPLPPHR
jgi:hypothetical protein